MGVGKFGLKPRIFVWVSNFRDQKVFFFFYSKHICRGRNYKFEIKVSCRYELLCIEVFRISFSVHRRKKWATIVKYQSKEEKDFYYTLAIQVSLSTSCTVNLFSGAGLSISYSKSWLSLSNAPNAGYFLFMY